MRYFDFQGTRLSRLGFGTMRLPKNEDGTINEPLAAEMTAYAIEHGLNYFDTAYPYHAGMSEVVMGRILSAFPRDSYYLATKYPGHQISEHYDPAAIFEEQLTKCGVEYFDFYLLHNVSERSIDTYRDPKWGIVDYFVRQKELGRIRHLGFSSHGRPDNLREFLDEYGDKMEFCQIQMNYLDWTLQDAKAKYELLTERGIPVWVMEPVRGGRLSKLLPGETEMLPGSDTPASYAFRWLMDLPNVGVVLSGMSDDAQMRENIELFSEARPLDAGEKETLAVLAERMKNAVPCTGCRYCCDGCPAGLDIPVLIQAYNDARFDPKRGMTVSMQIDALPEDKKPSACIGCGACTDICPQKIEVPDVMQKFTELIPELPDWVKICKQREEDAKKRQGK